MGLDQGTCTYWAPSECEGSAHCPPRCPRFVDAEDDAWVVRPAADDDRDAVVDMYDDFAPGERAQGLPPRTRSRIENWLDDRLADGSNFVVDGGDRVVGHALYTPTDDAVPEFAVFVHRDYQNRGIGTELSKHVVATAAAGDRDALELVVQPQNRAARKLYDRLGFETVQEHAAEPGRGLGALRMRLSLASPTAALELQRPPMHRSERARP